ncbi:MAG: DUF2341 domain-containing protein, partial [archaeon]
SEGGGYFAKINSTYGTEYGEQTQYLTVDAFPLVSSTAYIPTKVYYDTTAGALTYFITATVTDAANDLTSVNFTVTAPNGTKVINNVNATINLGDKWNTTFFSLNQYGQWNYSVSARDINNNTNNVSGTIKFLQITEALNVSVVNQNDSVTITGHINDSQCSSVANNTIYIYLNNTILNITNGWNCGNGWWNCTWKYRKAIDIQNNASNLTNYQVLIEENTALLVNDSKMQSNCNDIRFSQTNGSSLSYWIEEGCNTISTVIWVTLPQLPNGTTQIFMYYGNAIVSSASAFTTRPTTGINTGTGVDGTCLVSSNTNLNTGSCVGRENGDAASFVTNTNITTAYSNLTLSETPTGLAVGDEIIIINLKGTSSNYDNVGEYEFKRIKEINSNTLYFDTVFGQGFDGISNSVSVQRVPNYKDVTINSGTTFTVNAWDGEKGGILVFRSNQTVSVDGTISAAGLGYSGGEGAGGCSEGGKGESYRGNLGGGGGKDCYTTGAGEAGTTGGAGGGSDYNCAVSTTPAGAGGGGYGTVGMGGVGSGTGSSGSAGSGTTGGAGGSLPSLGGGGGGGGGGTYGNITLNRLYFGSGGAGSAGWYDTSCHAGYAGSKGGGIVMIVSNNLIVTNSVTTAAEDPSHTRAGGGAGGSVMLQSHIQSLGTSRVSAAGSTYGTDGGSGRIAVYYTSSSSGTTSPSASYNQTARTYNHDEEIIPQTDTNGNYNYTFTAPSAPGGYVIKVNSTYNSEYGEQTQNFIVDAIPFITSTAYIPTKVYYDTTAGALSVYITATVTDAANDLTSVNFTVTAPNGTNVIYNRNASNYIGSTWNSTSFYLNQYGQWNYSVSAKDLHNNTNNATGTIKFLQITEALNASVVNQNDSVTVSGHINDSRWASVVNQTICINLNNSAINGLYCGNGWWNTSFSYRKNISIESSIASSVNNSIVLVNFSTTSLISQGRMRSDCGDIRFVNLNNIELQYTSETSTCNSGNTVYWVWTNLTGNTNTTIWAYYGNSNASLKTDYSNPDNSLIAYYHFDNSSSYGEKDILAYDFSKKNNNLTCSGGTCPARTLSGKYGAAYYYNNDEYINTALPITVPGNVTISVWMNSTDSPALYERILDLAQSATVGLQIIFGPSGDFGIDNSGGPTSQVSSTGYNNGAWHNIIVTRNSTAYLVYIDGRYIGSSGGTFPTYTKLYIGRRSDGSSPYVGVVDEVRIYNRTFTKSDVLVIYNATRPYFMENETYTKTNNSGDYSYSFIAPSTPGDYVVKVNSTYGNEYGEQTQSFAVNSVPSISSASLSPASPNTSSNIGCYAIVTDNEQSSVTVEYMWYNNSIFSHGGNATSIPINSNSLIATLGNGNTTRWEVWNCTVRPNDGMDYGSVNSFSVNISNEPPTHNAPSITPAYPNITSNLTCNWNNVADSDSDAVVNITNWYKNNVSTTVLYMPFEGGSNSTYTKDYSGYGNNGAVSGATWNRTGGKVGGGYEFDNYNAITVPDNNILNITGNSYTQMFWFRVNEDVASMGSYPTLVAKRPWLVGGVGTYLYNATSKIVLSMCQGASCPGLWSNTVIQKNQWYHFAGVLNGVNMYIYINGIRDSNVSTVYVMNSSAGTSLSIGGGTFNGTIDEVKIYNYSLSAEQIQAEYQAGLQNTTPSKIVRNETAYNDTWLCSVTPNDGYTDGSTQNSSSVTITNSAPIITAFSLTPAYANTTSTLSCNATLYDGESSSITAYYYWYNTTDLKFSGTTTVTSGANTVITTLGEGNTTHYELWSCIIQAYDGIFYSSQNSSSVNITNIAPTQSAPTITPAYPNITSNLTCSWNSVADSDNDAVVNITNWYKNNRSTTVLYLPFEGGSNSTYTKDYSGYGNNGVVSSATWNRTGGKVGGGYYFDGNGDSLTISRTSSTYLTGSATMMVWVKIDEKAEPATWPTITGVNSNSEYRIYIGVNSSTIGTLFNTTSGQSYLALTNSNNLTLGIWYHITATYDNNTGQHKVYVNGQLNNSRVWSGNLVIGSGSITAGNNNFNGSIDEVKIYNSSLSQEQILADYQAGLSGKSTSILVRNETSTNDDWLCSVTPNDGYSDGETKNSSAVTIANNAPSKVTLLSPSNGNLSIYQNPPSMYWQASTDPEGYPLNYSINITSAACPDIGEFSNITILNFTPGAELPLDCIYYWKVRAFDGIDYGEWSDTWNFTLNTALILTMVNNSVNFGTLGLNATADTDTLGGPLVVRNDGNIVANITWVSINASMWETVGADTEYLQFKADNMTTESGSFNYSGSTTSWTNLSIISSQNKTIISNLNYIDTKDEAQIDIRVRVPSSEPVGPKKISLYIIGQQV